MMMIDDEEEEEGDVAPLAEVVAVVRGGGGLAGRMSQQDVHRHDDWTMASMTRTVMSAVVVLAVRAEA